MPNWNASKSSQKTLTIVCSLNKWKWNKDLSHKTIPECIFVICAKKAVTRSSGIHIMQQKNTRNLPSFYVLKNSVIFLLLVTLDTMLKSALHDNLKGKTVAFPSNVFLLHSKHTWQAGKYFLLHSDTLFWVRAVFHSHCVSSITASY